MIQAIRSPAIASESLAARRTFMAEETYAVITVRLNSSTASDTGGHIVILSPVTSKTLPWFFSAMFFIWTKLTSKFASPTAALSWLSLTGCRVSMESNKKVLRILVFICSGRLAHSLSLRVTFDTSCISSLFDDCLELSMRSISSSETKALTMLRCASGNSLPAETWKAASSRNSRACTMFFCSPILVKTHSLLVYLVNLVFFNLFCNKEMSK